MSCGHRSASSEGVLRGSPWRPSSPEKASLSSSSKGAAGDSRNARRSCSAQRWSALLTPASTRSGFRALGGATTRWAGQALPLQDIDFTARSWVPDSGWPLTPAELQPYLKRAEAILAIQTFGDPGEPRWPSVLPARPAFDERLLSTVYSQFSPSPNFAEVSRTRSRP